VKKPTDLTQTTFGRAVRKPRIQHHMAPARSGAHPLKPRRRHRDVQPSPPTSPPRPAPLNLPTDP